MYSFSWNVLEHTIVFMQCCLGLLDAEPGLTYYVLSGTVLASSSFNTAVLHLTSEPASLERREEIRLLLELPLESVYCR
jgi:hypothetical protein